MILTKRQKEILDFIKQHIKLYDYAPTLREIGEHFGLSSVATVHDHVKTLSQKGLLKKVEGRARFLELVTEEKDSGVRKVPLLGTVAAGSPIEALEDIETVTLPEEMLGLKETFILRVKGDSMIEEHILDGDNIVVEKSSYPENGQIVVALIGNEVTVKKIYREAGQIRLQPANINMSPIYIKEGEVDIQGIVIGILRNLR